MGTIGQQVTQVVINTTTDPEVAYAEMFCWPSCPTIAQLQTELFESMVRLHPMSQVCMSTFHSKFDSDPIAQGPVGEVA